MRGPRAIVVLCALAAPLPSCGNPCAPEHESGFPSGAVDVPANELGFPEAAGVVHIIFSPSLVVLSFEDGSTAVFAGANMQSGE
jgi:hypothetical protein